MSGHESNGGHHENVDATQERLDNLDPVVVEVLNNFASTLNDHGEELRDLRQQFDELRSSIIDSHTRETISPREESRLNDSGEDITEVPSQPEDISSNSEQESGREEEQKPDTIRDLERLAQITGRAIDDPELIKLNLKLKHEQFNNLRRAYDGQEGSVRQEGFMKDMATAKRELEEAMYLYEPEFAKMDEKRVRIRQQLERTTDPTEKTKLRRELFRLNDHGFVANQNAAELRRIDMMLRNENDPGRRAELKLQRSELEAEGKRTPRRDLADSLEEKLDNIVSDSNIDPEILATYELNKLEYPADPISSRRRSDTLDWRGKPEYDSNGIYIGSSPANNGRWILEPKPPAAINVIETADQPQLNPEPDTINIDDEGASLPIEEQPVNSDQSSDGEVPPISPNLGNESGDGNEGEVREAQKVEVPPIDLGDYPDLYARRKNLDGGQRDDLEKEARKLSESMTANIEAQVNNFIAENPAATPEEIRAFTLNCYVDAQNMVQEAVVAAIDGVGYTDAEGNEKGKSRLRRFGAWLDKHGSKLKKGLLVAGLAGAVVMTGGVLAGAIAPAFALGTGTVIGATKGAAVGLGMSRHGSKESASRDIRENMTQGFEQMSQEDSVRFAEISDYIMNQYNRAADKDHKLNVKKSARAATVGAVLGGLAGSLSFDSPNTVEVSQTISVANQPPDIPSHTIQPGELTGHIIQNTLREMGLSEGDRFVMPDGSTNLDAIYEYFTPEEWQQNSAIIADGTHAVEGANSLSNEGIRHIIQTIVNNHDWGSHSEIIKSSFTDMSRNWPATIAGWVSSGLLTAAAARQIADSTKKVKENVSEVQNNGGSQSSTVAAVPNTQEASRPTASEASSPTFEYGPPAQQLEIGQNYGLTVYQGTKPVRFVRMDGDDTYVFQDLELNREIKYLASQVTGPTGWLETGRLRNVVN